LPAFLSVSAAGQDDDNDLDEDAVVGVDEDEDVDVGAAGARLFVVLCCSFTTFWRWICSLLETASVHIEKWSSGC